MPLTVAMSGLTVELPNEAPGYSGACSSPRPSAVTSMVI